MFEGIDYLKEKRKKRFFQKKRRKETDNCSHARGDKLWRLYVREEVEVRNWNRIPQKEKT